MARRVSEIAKELNVAPKAIIEKCKAEGIPADKCPKGHASTVSAGLEASIKEWFSNAGPATAVETSEHLDLEKVRAKPRKKALGKAGDDSESSHGGNTAIAEPPSHIAPTLPVEVAIPDEPEPAAPQTPEPVAAPVALRPLIADRADTRPVSRIVEHASQHGNHHSAPVAPPAGPLTAVVAPVAQTTTRAPLVAPPSRIFGPRPSPSTTPPVEQFKVVAPVAPVVKPTLPPPAPVVIVAPPVAVPSPVVQPRHAVPKAVVVAPKNVPTRPTVVAPAGKQVVPQTVVLRGPKVIRVEAAEPADVGGPRRPAAGGPPRGGRGVIGTDADSRSPRRRNDRRGPGPVDAAAAAASKRRAKGGEELPNQGVFREQDLVEREERLARAGGYLKQRRRELKARSLTSGGQFAPELAEGRVQIKSPFTIKELAEASGIKSSDIIKKLFLQGIMATPNVAIDPERATEIMLDFDIDLEVVTARTAEERVSDVFVDRKSVDVQSRAPVVTIMGHVDHGKTSLLDRIRNAKVAEGEAGGITQKTSAFRTTVEVGGEKKPIVFLDTPGHQAFTEMRSRGANLTDIVVLVVSAADGVMPQTVESINHAKAAKVQLVVALNKIDSPQATESQIQKIYGQLAGEGLNPVVWGGQTEVVKTSALKGTGINELLEILDLQAQLLELKADKKGPARGRVVESTRDEGRGPIATILIQEGELKIGDFIVVGRAFGRVRDITDDRGQRIKFAGPSMPVQISGIDMIPDAGDSFFVSDSLRKAEEAAEQRRTRERHQHLQQPKVTLDSLLGQMKDSEVKEILIVLKADVQGSVDVIRNEVERLSTAEVKIRVLHAAVGGITESDVALAEASKAVIVGFNVIPTGKARGLAEVRSVEIRTYQVIYDITEDVKKAASGMLKPEIRQEILGHAEVRKVFKVTRVGTIAGCYVTDGLVQRDALIRVTRNGIVIENDRVLEQLKRVKDDVKDVRANTECGMKIVGYDDIKEGDVLECYKKVEIKRTL